MFWNLIIGNCWKKTIIGASKFPKTIMKEQLESPVIVSVQCMAYNHEPYIRECLEGFVMQKTKQ